MRRRSRLIIDHDVHAVPLPMNAGSLDACIVPANQALASEDAIAGDALRHTDASGTARTGRDRAIAGGSADRMLRTHVGNSSTSRIEGEPVNNITSRSMPTPSPPSAACRTRARGCSRRRSAWLRRRRPPLRADLLRGSARPGPRIVQLGEAVGQSRRR